MAEKLVMEEALTEEQMMQSNAESEDLVDEENTQGVFMVPVQ